MGSDLSLVSALRETAAQQGVQPTDEDLQGVLDFLTRILPALAETFVQLGLTHSKVAFPPPSEIVDDRFFALPSAEALV